ncbi:hypothetical protein AB0D98_27335 [Streptomyces sp. NPDC047987]|uniref:hypothetical protein n=1 Tax=unclassified Streptomyces TaxID=2593676 RepID=UPI0034461EB0
MTKSKDSVIAASLAAAVALAAGGAYLLEFPPFEGTRTIEAGEICKNLGSSEKAVPALRGIAPPRSKYSFVEQENQGKITYFSGCHGVAEDAEFLVTRTEYTTLSGTFETWVEGPASHMVDTENPKNFTRFGTGSTDTWGVVSKDKAAVSTPCFADKKQSLTTIVLLRDAAEQDGTRDSHREELVDLVNSAAEFAHQDAGCTLPLELDQG